MNTLNMSSKCQLCNSDLPGMQGSHKERNHYVQYNYDYYEYVVGKTMITFVNNGYGRYSEYGNTSPSSDFNRWDLLFTKYDQSDLASVFDRLKNMMILA